MPKPSGRPGRPKSALTERMLVDVILGLPPLATQVDIIDALDDEHGIAISRNTLSTRMAQWRIKDTVRKERRYSPAVVETADGMVAGPMLTQAETMIGALLDCANDAIAGVAIECAKDLEAVVKAAAKLMAETSRIRRDLAEIAAAAPPSPMKLLEPPMRAPVVTPEMIATATYETKGQA